MSEPKQNKTKDKEKIITVGTDEFCSNCMEWREFDEGGRCKVCGKIIKTKQQSRVSYNEYEIDSEFDSNESEGDYG